MNRTFDLILKNQKDNFDNFISSRIEKDVDNFVRTLINYKDKNIFIIGIGKCSSLSMYISDILKSINLRSFNINCTNLTHGDLGCINDDDLVIFISKSGNTNELINSSKHLSCYQVLITCCEDSIMEGKVDTTFVIPFKYEADLFYNTIPSNSSTNILFFFNFVINIYIEKSCFNFEKYKQCHPSGDIGFKNKKIKEFLNTDISICKNFNLTNDEIIKQVLSSKNALIFHKDDKFYGILTTKDVLTEIDNIKNGKSIYDYINTSPIVLNNPDDYLSSKINMLKKYRLFKFIPVLKDSKCVGILDNSMIIK